MFASQFFPSYFVYFFFTNITMGACASTPKESDILETPATTENAVVESMNVQTEAVSQVFVDQISFWFLSKIVNAFG